MRSQPVTNPAPARNDGNRSEPPQPPVLALAVRLADPGREVAGRELRPQPEAPAQAPAAPVSAPVEAPATRCAPSSGASQNPGSNYGTSVHFAKDPTEAAKQALADRKLLVVFTISGNFEDAKFT